MPWPETHFDQVTHNPDSASSLYVVDPFSYFRGGIRPARKLFEVEQPPRGYLTRSAVDFCLSYTNPNLSDFPFVRILGDGEGLLAVYAENLKAPEDVDVNLDKVRYWNLFSTERKGKIKFEPSTKRKPQNIQAIFTTFISPFLHSDSRPIFGTKIYSIDAGNGSDIMEVTATIMKDQTKDTLSVTYLPDPRNYDPVPITTIIRDEDCWKLTVPNS